MDKGAEHIYTQAGVSPHPLPSSESQQGKAACCKALPNHLRPIYHTLFLHVSFIMLKQFSYF